MAILVQNRKKDINKFFKIAPKVAKELVLYDRIVILPGKYYFGAKLGQVVESHDPDKQKNPNFVFIFFLKIDPKKSLKAE